MAGMYLFVMMVLFGILVGSAITAVLTGIYLLFVAIIGTSPAIGIVFIVSTIMTFGAYYLGQYIFGK